MLRTDRHMTTRPTRAAIGAYFVLSHGRAATARPRTTSTPVVAASGRHASAIMTARAAGTSGKTVKLLKRNGEVTAAAAQPNVAASVEPVTCFAQLHSRVAASAAMRTSIATTPGYPASQKAGSASTGRPTGCTE